jgi:hypothetical protein
VELEVVDNGEAGVELSESEVVVALGAGVELSEPGVVVALKLDEGEGVLEHDCSHRLALIQHLDPRKTH